MTKQAGLSWKVYSVLFFFTASANAASIFFPESALYSYYHTLIAFNRQYFVAYYLNIASAMMIFLSLVPLLLFTFRIRFLGKRFWQWFFCGRIIFELTGHAYEAKFIKSLSYESLWLVVLSLALAAAILAPSYIANFLYAFRQNKLLKE